MRVLVVKTSSLGDLFHALPTVHLLRTGLNARIDWVVNRCYAPLVSCFRDVERVIPFPRDSLFKNLAAFGSDLRAENYDQVVDLQGLLKSALITRAACADRRLGPSFHREGSHLLYDQVVAARNKNRHAVDENLDVLRFLGLPAEPVDFPVSFPPSRLVQDSPGPRILFSPCSRHAAKNWPIERFAEVGRTLYDTFDAVLYISGVPQDAAVCAELENSLPAGACVNLCGKTSLVELGSLLQRMDLAVTVDSGPMHMAAAIGTPTLAVFGPTDPVRVGPYGLRHRVLRRSQVAGYSKSDMESIRAVGVADVLSTACEMLSRDS